MEYVSLEERILKECNDQAKEYLIKHGTNGLINLFKALTDDTAKKLMSFLQNWKKDNAMDLSLCMIPLVLKNGKSFETNKTIRLIKSISPDISDKDLFDCIILFSYIFDLFYGINLDDTIENINALNEDCINIINVPAIPKLERNNITTDKNAYNSIIILNDYIKSKQINFENYNYVNETSKAVSFFLRGIENEGRISNKEDEKKYGNSIKKFLLSI